MELTRGCGDSTLIYVSHIASALFKLFEGLKYSSMEYLTRVSVECGKCWCGFGFDGLEERLVCGVLDPRNVLKGLDIHVYRKLFKALE